MSKSKLEEDLYEQMRLLSMEVGSTFSLPVRELHFMWCCEHPRREHDLTFAGGWCGRCFVENDDCSLDWHEYKHARNWRFDFAWPALMIAAEVEGGTHNGGRHVQPAGFEKDAEKYNEAALRGWQVLRFTRRQVTSGEALRVIERALATQEEEAAE